MQEKMFTESEIGSIASALGDTAEGLKGAEITRILIFLKLNDPTPSESKRMRLHNVFVDWQNQQQNRLGIIAFIREAMKPVRYTQQPNRFELLRTNLNHALAFSGLAVDAAGKLFKVDQAQTLTDAARRAQELRDDLTLRGVHPDVLRFCHSELIANNYFHAVLEATKSIADKLRAKTNLVEDGAALVDKALTGDSPLLAINPLATESQRSEQRGFANLVKGTFGMFRNTTAHEPRIIWEMKKEDAEDLLSLASLIHRRLDTANIRS